MERSQRTIVVAVLLAAAGCALIKTPESQIWSSHGKYDTATIAYRLLPASDDPAKQPTGERRYTLLIQYPHPKGLSGYARAELIVERPSAGNREDIAQPSNWSKWWKNTLGDNLPGMAFGEGVEKALGYDVPIGKIDKVIDRLDETGYFGAASECASDVVLVAKINSVEFRKAWRRVPELDAIVSELRQEGKVISRRQPPPESDFALPPSTPDSITRLPHVQAAIR